MKRRRPLRFGTLALLLGASLAAAAAAAGLAACGGASAAAPAACVPGSDNCPLAGAGATPPAASADSGAPH